MKCACGSDLHYHRLETQQAVERLVAELGELQKIVTPDGAWMVPRHYVALHGIKAAELPRLAEVLGFEKVDD